MGEDEQRKSSSERLGSCRFLVEMVRQVPCMLPSFSPSMGAGSRWIGGDGLVLLRVGCCGCMPGMLQGGSFGGRGLGGCTTGGSHPTVGWWDGGLSMTRWFWTLLAACCHWSARFGHLPISSRRVMPGSSCQYNASVVWAGTSVGWLSRHPRRAHLPMQIQFKQVLPGSPLVSSLEGPP